MGRLTLMAIPAREAARRAACGQGRYSRPLLADDASRQPPADKGRRPCRGRLEPKSLRRAARSLGLRRWPDTPRSPLPSRRQAPPWRREGPASSSTVRRAAARRDTPRGRCGPSGRTPLVPSCPRARLRNCRRRRAQRDFRASTRTSSPRTRCGGCRSQRCAGARFRSRRWRRSWRRSTSTSRRRSWRMKIHGRASCAARRTSTGAARAWRQRSTTWCATRRVCGWSRTCGCARLTTRSSSATSAWPTASTTLRPSSGARRWGTRCTFPSGSRPSLQTSSRATTGRRSWCKTASASTAAKSSRWRATCCARRCSHGRRAGRTSSTLRCGCWRCRRG